MSLLLNSRTVLLRLGRRPDLHVVVRRGASSGGGGGRNFLPALADRGLLQHTFPPTAGREMASHLQEEPRCIYAGFDPTAESLHIGNLLIIVSLLHCQRAGHKVIALIGGATARVGDPSGKSTERPMLPAEVLEQNVLGLRKNLAAIFANHAEHFGHECRHSLHESFAILDNHEWHRRVDKLEFLGRTCRHFRLGRMLTKTSVKTRLESEDGLSLTEFLYQVLQAEDWLRLYKDYKCTVQLGGSDQMGNIHAGHEYISRVTSAPVFGATVPLITSETGAKLGKTATASAVWLSSDKTSVFDFYQYFVRLSDSQLQAMLLLFTFLPKNQVADLMDKHAKAPERRLAQKKLAKLATLLVHGQSGLDLALKATRLLYPEKDQADDGASLAQTLSSLTPDEMASVFPASTYLRLFHSTDMSLIQLLMKIGCFQKERDAVRVIAGGGFYVNQVRRQNPEEIVVPGNHIMPNGITLVRVGKKNYYVIEWTM